MTDIKKSVLVAHTAHQMFELVDKVEDYPNFLPWCKSTEVITRKNNTLEAMIYMDYMKIKQQFGTRNHNIPDREIKMSLLDGPFRYLEGSWQFSSLGTLGCKIDFYLQYEFSSMILTRLIGPVFSHISGSLVDAFIKEADKRYPKK